MASPPYAFRVYKLKHLNCKSASLEKDNSNRLGDPIHVFLQLPYARQSVNAFATSWLCSHRGRAKQWSNATLRAGTNFHNIETFDSPRSFRNERISTFKIFPTYISSEIYFCYVSSKEVNQEANFFNVLAIDISLLLRDGIFDLPSYCLCAGEWGKDLRMD